MFLINRNQYHPVKSAYYEKRKDRIYSNTLIYYSLFPFIIILDGFYSLPLSFYLHTPLRTNSSSFFLIYVETLASLAIITLAL